VKVKSEVAGLDSVGDEETESAHYRGVFGCLSLTSDIVCNGEVQGKRKRGRGLGLESFEECALRRDRRSTCASGKERLGE